jgi:predicted Ser/Thr protein kinase
VTPEQLEECLREQEGMAGPDRRPIGALLVAKRYLTAAQLADLLSFQRARDPRSSEPRMPEEVASAKREGRTFGAFVLVRELGEGGTGVVWKAWDTNLARWVALKFLKLQSRDGVKRFVREAQSAASLSHPNIVPVYATGEHDGKFYIAMRYIEGQRLGEERLTPSRAAEMMRDVALAVEYAHESGLVHRDIKPQNVLVAGDGKPYITDFGLARELEGAQTATATGSVVGTPFYMAPEQAEGRTREIDARSDVYALGATLYHLLCGTPPFQDTALAGILRKVSIGDLRPPRQIDRTIPIDLETICLKAMEREKERRYGSAGAMAEDLRRFLGGEELIGRRASWGYRVRTILRRHPGVLIVAATLLTGLGAFEWLRQQSTLTEYERAMIAGMTHYQQEHYEAAVEAYDRALSFDARSLDALRMKTYAEARLRGERLDKDRAMREEEEAAGVEEVEAQLRDVETLELAGGDASGAARAIAERAEGMAGRRPEWKRAWLAAARARRAAGDLDRAARDVEQVLSAEPDHAAANLERGWIEAQRMREFAAPVARVEEGFVHWSRPGGAPAERALGPLARARGAGVATAKATALAAAGRDDEAMALLGARPRDVLLKAECLLYGKRDRAGSRALLEPLVQQFPRWRAAAAVMARASKLPEAAAMLDAMLQAGGDGALRADRALVRHAMGDARGAVDEFTRALGEGERTRLVFEGRGRARLAVAGSEAGTILQAIADLEEARARGADVEAIVAEARARLK